MPTVDLRVQEAAQFHTKAAREAAEKAKAASYGPIPVRVHLPDNTILQAAFSALEPLSKLQVRWVERLLKLCNWLVQHVSCDAVRLLPALKAAFVSCL